MPKNRGRAGNPIDAFLADRLTREGLTPAPEADKETLIRRVAFALTGPAADAAGGRRLPRRLVAGRLREAGRPLPRVSPQYGEEMARHWLDVARYADTHGLHLDNERQMWPYRDWVVKAFNDNLPFDRFTVEQLAGDLLPNPTPDQLVATGLQPLQRDDGRGRVDRRRVVLPQRRRPHEHDVAETWIGLTAGLRRLPRPQVRPALAEGVLLALRLLLLRRRPAPWTATRCCTSRP